MALVFLQCPMKQGVSSIGLDRFDVSLSGNIPKTPRFMELQKTSDA
jgi:hypothetical protein